MSTGSQLEEHQLKEQYNNWWKEREAEFPESERTRERDRKNFRKIYSYFGRLKGGRLLDVSCSNGRFLWCLEADTDLELHGVDISDVAVNSASKKLKRSLLYVGDAQNMVFEDNYFDYVTCLGSLEHYPDPVKGAREISRVLKPDGTALIMVPNLYFIGHIYMAVRYGIYPSEGGQEFSEMFSTSKGWEDLLVRGGLQVISVRKHNEVGVTNKVSRGLMMLWNMFKPLIPIRLSCCFIFICQKMNT